MYSMENKTVENVSGKGAKALLRGLTFYPFVATVGFLLGGAIESTFLVWFTLLTFVFALYLGTLVWLGLAFYLLLKKKMLLKEVLFYFIVAFTGAVTTYFVIEYDILSSGAKYID